MNRNELSLLLFLETRAVDYRGRVDIRHMNDEDVLLARKWSKEGFIEYGRIRIDDVNMQGSYWVHLSDKAMRAAHTVRHAEAERTWKTRPYKTTAEERQRAESPAT